MAPSPMVTRGGSRSPGRSTRRCPPDDQLVPKFGVVEEDVALLKLRGVFQVVVIGVVPTWMLGGGNDVFRKQDVLYSLGKTVLGSGMSNMF